MATRVTNRGKALLAGAALTANIGGAMAGNATGEAIGKAIYDHSALAAQETAKKAYFSNPNLVEDLEAPDNPNANEILKYGRIALFEASGDDKTYWDIANELGASNRGRAIDEMTAQNGEILHAGDVMALPMDELNSQNLKNDPMHELPADSTWASDVAASANRPPSDNEGLVTYVIPKQ